MFNFEPSLSKSSPESRDKSTQEILRDLIIGSVATAAITGLALGVADKLDDNSDTADGWSFSIID